MEFRRLWCLHVAGILLCLFLNPILTIETDQEKLDEYIQNQGHKYDAFEWNLLKALGSPEFGNVILSPLSVKMVLAMVYEGASGATEKELEQVVNFPPNKQDTKKKYQKIIESMNTVIADQTLDMGSRVFLDNSVQPQQRFEAALKSFYNTDVKPVEFHNASDTKEEINYWVSNVTHGYIRELVTEADLHGATMIMANALFFKGLWRKPFPRENTHMGVFYTAPNRPIQVPYMHLQVPLYYSESIEFDAKILRLPFKGDKVVMFIILPNSKAGLPRLINDLSPEALRRQIGLIDDQQTVNVYLPRFSFEFNAKLGRILQTLGLHHIFQNTASLAGIARGKGVIKKLMVSNILQKAGIEVNEEGSTAYAATEISLSNKFGAREVNFNASHPFLFYIEDEFTGNVLFAGKVENPVQVSQPPFSEELNFPNRIGEVTQEEEDNSSSASSSTKAPVATSTNAQNQNFAAQNQNFGQQSQHFGTTHFPIYSQFYEENDLSAEQFFYFDIDLLKEIAHDQREGNILISPLSIKSVLAMILEGAANESANELRMALHLPNNKRVRQQFQKLLTEFENPKGGVNLKMANRVFISKNLSPLDKYRDIITQYYYSNVTKLDFSNPTLSANTINSWVSEHTRGIIPTLVDEGSFGGDVSILLANALYFKGMWEKAFSELGTKTNCFYLSNGECQMTPMMDVVNNFKYDEVKKLDAKVLELTYSGGEYSMVIVLPNNKYGIQQLTRDIRTSINSIVQNLNETEVFVTLPRFKIDYSTDLVNYFPKVHITNIIGPKAMLPGIVADVGVRVSNALHKTYIEVNEQGTVAAAATGAVVIPLMGTTKPRFKADHPFLFFIRHTATGTILFEGRLSVPERSYVQPNQQQNPQQNNQQNPQQNNQQNQQHRPPQGNVQRPVNQQPTFLSTTQNNYNQNIQPQSQPQPQPQNQNGFATQQSFQTQRPAFQSSSQQQPSFQGQQVSFQSQTPPNYQGQQTQFQNPAQTAYQQTYLQQQQQQQQHILQPESIFEETRGHILKHIPQLNIPSNRQGQVQPNEANVNDLRNNEKSKPLYSESESLPIVYEDEINSKRLQ